VPLFNHNQVKLKPHSLIDFVQLPRLNEKIHFSFDGGLKFVLSLSAFHSSFPFFLLLLAVFWCSEVGAILMNLFLQGQKQNFKEKHHKANAIRKLEIQWHPYCVSNRPNLNLINPSAYASIPYQNIPMVDVR